MITVQPKAWNDTVDFVMWIMIQLKHNLPVFGIHSKYDRFYLDQKFLLVVDKQLECKVLSSKYDRYIRINGLGCKFNGQIFYDEEKAD